MAKHNLCYNTVVHCQATTHQSQHGFYRGQLTQLEVRCRLTGVRRRARGARLEYMRGLMEYEVYAPMQRVRSNALQPTLRTWVD